MDKILDLAESHLLNVQREIQSLTQRRAEIDREIQNMTEFLNEALSAVEEYKLQSQEQPTP